MDLTDSYGDVTQFYDVYRDGTGRPVPHSLGVDQAQKYGRFKSYTAADGSTQVNATYDSNSFLMTVTRGPTASATTEEMVYTYATVTNDLVTAAGDAPPQLLASVTLQRPDGMGSWVPAQRALYTYYTGRLSNGMGGWLNDPNGRLGDLQLVQVQNAVIGSGGMVTWQGVDTTYYRYDKLTAESYNNTTSKGPTNKSSTAGGPNPIQPAGGSYRVDASRCHAIVRRQTFQTCLRQWLLDLSGVVKAPRGSASPPPGPWHLVSAWATHYHWGPGQVAVATKSHEIPAIPALLGLLEPHGAAVPIDASGCHTAVAEYLVQKGGDDVLTVKDNPPHLVEGIRGGGAQVVGPGVAGRDYQG